MDAPRFDALTRSLAGIRSRRSALQGFLLGAGGLLSLTAAQDAEARNCKKIKNKKRRKKCLANQAPPRCVLQLQCGEGCCEPDSCFASAVDDELVQPLGYACCPAEKLCRSTKPPVPDQCCYPDETCRPSLTELETETICCRPCAGGVGGCCLKLNEECQGGVCVLVNTARLARTRRPG
jgi:hypothetical protein